MMISLTALKKHAEALLPASAAIRHNDVLDEIKAALKPVADWRAEAKLDDKEKVSTRDYYVVAVREIVRVAQELNCGLCKTGDIIYTFNGQHWRSLERDRLAAFLGESSEKLSIKETQAQDHRFRDALFRQFLATAYLPRPERSQNTTLVNLGNGTFEITTEAQFLREHRREDFLTYVLPFEYDSDARCPKWQMFLDYVLPDPSRQAICAEFIGYAFTSLKLEKVFLPYGGGANGKSVFFDVISALLGDENVSHFSLQSLGHEYNRAKIADKLLNYSSEISTRIEAETLKKLASGEPIEARLPYGQPFELKDYAKLAFNCNELPREVEHSEAFFRRFLIVPFDVTVPEQMRNPNLAKEIIADELPGVFNWVLDGLKRLLQQGNFSECKAAREAVELYRKESDSVALFIEEIGLKPDGEKFMYLSELFTDYKTFATECGYKPLGKVNFSKRLSQKGFRFHRFNTGQVIYAQKS